MIFTFGSTAVNVSRADGTATIVRDGQDDVVLSIGDVLSGVCDDDPEAYSEGELAEIVLAAHDLDEESGIH